MLAVMLIIVIVGIIWYVCSGQMKKEQEAQNKRMAEAYANLAISRAKLGQTPLTNKEIDDITGITKAKQAEETKKIVKGAVVGGIVAGDAGAIVGATIAKNKIDSEKGNNK